MALYTGVRAVTSHRRLERSRVCLVLRAVRAHVAAVPGRLVVDDEKRSQKKDRKKDRKKRGEEGLKEQKLAQNKAKSRGCDPFAVKNL